MVPNCSFDLHFSVIIRMLNVFLIFETWLVYFFKYVFIYLAVLVLSYGTQDLQSPLKMQNLLVAACELLVPFKPLSCSMWNLDPGKGK